MTDHKTWSRSKSTPEVNLMCDGNYSHDESINNPSSLQYHSMMFWDTQFIEIKRGINNDWWIKPCCVWNLFSCQCIGYQFATPV